MDPAGADQVAPLVHPDVALKVWRPRGHIWVGTLLPQHRHPGRKTFWKSRCVGRRTVKKAMAKGKKILEREKIIKDGVSNKRTSSSDDKGKLRMVGEKMRARVRQKQPSCQKKSHDIWLCGYLKLF